MYQLPTHSMVTKRGTSFCAAETFLAPTADYSQTGEVYINSQQLESLGSDQSAQTKNSEFLD